MAEENLSSSAENLGGSGSPSIDDVQRLSDIEKQKKELLLEEGALIEKAFNSNDPELIIKANQRWNDVKSQVDSTLKSEFFDPTEVLSSVGYKNSPKSISFGILRKMSRTPIIRAIIGTRQAQVAQFSVPQGGRFDTGFVIEPKRGHYEKDVSEMNKSQLKRAQELTDFVLQCGDDNAKWSKDDFSDFLKKIVDDSLSLDHTSFEIARNMMGEPVEFAAVDAATVRLADTFDDKQFKENMQNSHYEPLRGHLPSYVQLVDGEVKHIFYPWEMCVGIRNKSTNIYANNYGRSELEDLIEIVTWMLWGDQYNGKFFAQGSTPKGLFKVAPGTSRSKVEQFRMHWAAMVAGVQNSHKIPVMETDSMEWIDMWKSNKDMEFGKWQEYLIRVACAVYKITPAEIGFDIEKSGGGGLSESGNEVRLQYSRDKGLKPLLTYIQSWINKYIVQPKDPDFEFRFVGMELDSIDKELDRDIKIVQNFGGWKEARVKWGKDADLDEGDFPLNSVYAQITAQQDMASQMNEGAEVAEEDNGSVWDSLDVEKSVESNPLMNDVMKYFEKSMSE